MTAQDLVLISKIHGAIDAQIIENGYLKLSKLSKVFDDAGIDRSIYLKTGPKKWLEEHYQEFYIEGSNGKETILYRENKLEAIAGVLRGVLKSDEKVLLSLIPGLLAAHGLQYKEYAGNLRLSEWITKQFPGAKTEQGLWLTEMPQEAPMPMPEKLTAAQRREVAQMQAAVLMNWRSAGVRRLRAYNPRLSGEEVLEAQVAGSFARAMLGEPGAIVYAKEPGRAAVKTALSTSEGEAIYCILEENPHNEDGSGPAWVLLDFACSGDESELGAWLRPIVGDNSAKQRVLELKAATDEIAAAFQAQAAALAAYGENLAAGKMPAVRIGETLCAFEKKADEYRQLYEKTMGEAYPLEDTIAEIRRHLEEQTAVSRQIKAAAELFCTMAQGVHQLILDNRFPTGEQSTPQKDILAVQEAGGADFANLNPDLLAQMLAPYRALQKTMAAQFCSDEIENLIESVVCAHFAEISYRNAVRLLIGASDEERRFLDALDEIERILASCTAKVNLSPDVKREELSAEALAAQVEACGRDGVRLAQLAARILPEDETACMHIFGAADAENENLQARTFYAAGARLSAAFGDEGDLAEKYYLLALPFETEQAAQALLDLYRRRGDRARFAQIYTRFAGDLGASLENRIFYLSVLCEEDEDSAMQYADEHYYLFYQRESLRLLCALSDEVIAPVRRRALMERSARLGAYTQPNDFEAALLRGDSGRIREFAQDPAALALLGYEDNQIARIVKAAGDASDTGADDYDIGLRFFRFQQNLHGLAERYMWAGIAKNPNLVGFGLMLLLAQESRFD